MGTNFGNSEKKVGALFKYEYEASAMSCIHTYYAGRVPQWRVVPAYAHFKSMC